MFKCVAVLYCCFYYYYYYYICFEDIFKFGDEIAQLRTGQPRSRGAVPGRRKRFFGFVQRPPPALVPSLCNIHCVLETLSLRVKSPEREADRYVSCESAVLVCR
jgi:hypothetical protein